MTTNKKRRDRESERERLSKKLKEDQDKYYASLMPKYDRTSMRIDKIPGNIAEMSLKMKHNRPLNKGPNLRLPVRLNEDLRDNTVVAVFDWKDLRKWVLGIITSFIPTYELYVVEDYDNEKETYVVPRALLHPILPVDLTLSLNIRVLAVYPKTTTFYEGKIINLNEDNSIRIKFLPDENDPIGIKRNINRHFVLKFDNLQKCKINGLTNKVELECKQLAVKYGPLQTSNQSSADILKAPYDASLLPKRKRNDISFLIRYGLMQMRNTSDCNTESLQYKFPPGSYVLVKQMEQKRCALRLGIVQRNSVCDSLLKVRFLKEEGSWHFEENEMMKFPQISTIKVGMKVFAISSEERWKLFPAKVIGKESSNHWTVKFDVGRRCHRRKVHKMFIVNREED